MNALHSLLVLSVLLPAPGSGQNAFDRMLPQVMSRFKELRKTLLPIPDDTLQEVLFHTGTFYIPLDSKSELCKNHSNLLFDSFLQNHLWALRMVDASSKLPSGLLDGNIMDLGNYDQCLSVEAPGKLFRGQHCFVETKGLLPDGLITLSDEGISQAYPRLDIAFSLCVPSSCTSRDVSTHIDVTLNSVNASAVMSDFSCSSALPLPLHTQDFIAIFVILLITILIILSTAYDMSIIPEKSEVLRSFSLSRNLSRMLDTRCPPSALSCLNGLRVLALGWVILGHRLLYKIFLPNYRFMIVAEKISTLPFAPFESGHLSVEVFFLISGILVTYCFLRYRQKHKKFSLAHFYLYRYLRLTPALAMMMLLYATLGIRLTDGPLWNRVFGFLQAHCQQNWWTNLLYIQNYYNPKSMCVSQSWYLASDFQLYLVSPLLLVPLYHRPATGLALTTFCLILTTSAGLWNAYSLQLRAGGPLNGDMKIELDQVKEYFSTHLRAASFLMGIAFGYLLYKVKQGLIIIKLSTRTLCAGWLTSVFFILFSVMFVTVFQQPDYVYTPWLDTLYLVLYRHIFSIGIIWIIFVCTLGYGGVVDRFLSGVVWTPLARLTFCIYLSHGLVLTIESGNQRTNMGFTWFSLWYEFVSDFTLSCLSGAILYLAVEAPCTNVTTWAFRGGKEASRKTSKDTCQDTPLPVFKYIS